MASMLLATKLRIPPQTHHVVQRARLVDAIERGIPDYQLTLISAPAGYGKTTLLAQWAHASRFPVVWLSISEEDNDPERFFRYLLAGWEEAQPGLMESPLGMLLGAMMPDFEAVLAAFVNVADEAPEHTVFVLDDYHLIDDPAIHEALAFLLDNSPTTLHFVLAVRGEPPLPVARYRARDEMLELDADDLHFLADEADEFLNRRMALDLQPDEVVALQAQVEGWATGLQLAGLTLRRRGQAEDAPAVTGRNRFIADYLNEDVLAHLPDNHREFLLQTSILDRLSAPLCDTVTGNQDGREMLETLERENLFLVPLDDSREWFRYHRLFAGFLRDEIARRYPAEVVDLHRRAARWYWDQDLPEPALRHAIDGEDPDLAARIFERYVNIKLNSGELRDVARWLDSIPAEWHIAYPAIGVARAGLFAYTGRFEECLRCADDVEQHLILTESDDTRWQLAIVASLRCFIACIQNDLAQAEMHADRALQDLRDESRSFRASIYHALGDTYRQNGYWDKAEACYLKVSRFTAGVPGFHVQSVVQSAHVFGALADLKLEQGQLRDAAGYWRKALEAIQAPESWGRLELPVTGWVHIRMGEVLYEWNHLAEAWDHLSRGLERAELGGDVRALIAGYLLAARVKLTQGDTEAASDYLERARSHIEQAPFPEWTGRFERLQLDLWLAQDRLRAAVHWVDAMLEPDALEGHPEPEVARLAMARVLIVKGDVPALSRALDMLGSLIEEAGAEGRAGIQIEALTLQALGYWRRGERAEAMTALERALRLAEPEGYLRLFADLGIPMARLLQEARARDVMPDYVGALLAAHGPDLALPDSPEQALPEPLTDRELEILELLAAGLTNPEIAAKLFISPQTVKKHAGNVYGKLGVRTRTEAVARARKLDLLE